MAVVTIPSGLRQFTAEESHAFCGQLEAGEILYFPITPVPLTSEDISFLLGQQQADSSLHKNIAYKPNIDRLSGFDAKAASPEAVQRLHGIMRRYSQSVVGFLADFLAPYQSSWKLDYASFRPLEEEGRDLPQRRRNDLLHTDAFPTRPTHGARILRFFNNIHPTRTRDWIVSDPFATTVRQFVPQEIAPRPGSLFSRFGKAAGRAVGLGAAIPSLKRSPYDDFMMRFHNFLKENPRFQADCPRYPFQFPPGSSWMVYTDTVPHAVLAGQYALEQTFLVPPQVMVRPEISPLRILESLVHAPLEA
jgi:hypothetical protein